MIHSGANEISRLASLLLALFFAWAGPAAAQEEPEPEKATEKTESPAASEPREGEGPGEKDDEEQKRAQQELWARQLAELTNSDTDDLARSTLTIELYKQGDESVKARLRKLLRDSGTDVGLRSAILHGIGTAVGSIFDEQDVSILSDFLFCAAAEQERVRRGAIAQCLGELRALQGPEQSEQLQRYERRLRERIQDPKADFEERLGACRIVAERQDLSVIPLVLDFLDDRAAQSEEVTELRRAATERHRIVQVLRQLTDLRLGADGAAWRSWWKEFVSGAEDTWRETWKKQPQSEILRLARLAGERREREILDLKKRLLAEAPELLVAEGQGLFDPTDPEVRRFAAQRLLEIAERSNGNGRWRPVIEAALPRLLARLDREGLPDIRELLVELLGRYGSQDVAVRDRLIDHVRRYGTLPEQRRAVQALSRFSGLVVLREMAALLDRIVTGLAPMSLLGDTLRALPSVCQFKPADDREAQQLAATKTEVGKDILVLLENASERRLDTAAEIQLLKTLGAFPVSGSRQVISELLAARDQERWKVRLEAVRSIEGWLELGVEQRLAAITTLLDGLEDPAGEVRLEVLKQLALKHLKDLPPEIVDQRDSWAARLAQHLAQNQWGPSNEHELEYVIASLASLAPLSSHQPVEKALLDLLASLREPTTVENPARFREAARCLIDVLGQDVQKVDQSVDELASRNSPFAAAILLEDLLARMQDATLTPPSAEPEQTGGSPRWKMTSKLARLWLLCDEDRWCRQALSHIDALRAVQKTLALDEQRARALEAAGNLEEAIQEWRRLRAVSTLTEADQKRIDKRLAQSLLKQALLEEGGEERRAEAFEILARHPDWLSTADGNDRVLLALFARARLETGTSDGIQAGIDAYERLMKLTRPSAPSTWDWKASLIEALLARNGATDLERVQELLRIEKGIQLPVEQTRRFEALRQRLDSLRQSGSASPAPEGEDHGGH